MATRIYLPQTGAAPITPAFGTWTELTGADRIAGVATRIGSAMTSKTRAVRLYHDRPARVDEATSARVGREREEAGRRLGKTRDVLAWQRDMAQLDAEEQAARQPTETGRLSSGEVVSYLRSLPALWADSGPDGRQAMAVAIFARMDVMGFERMEYLLTPEAIELGLDAALPAVYELRGDFGEFGRGERI